MRLINLDLSLIGRPGMEARRELIEAVRERYQKSERAEKKQILDELAEMAV
jgi:hypothetical protein